MAVVLAINSVIASNPGVGIDFTQNYELVNGDVTLSGNYGTHSPANGDTMSFAGFDKIKSQQIPEWVRVFQYGTSPNAPVHYTFQYFKGTTQANGVLVVIDTTTGLPLTDAAAYPSTLTSSPSVVDIRFEACFPSFI